MQTLDLGLLGQLDELLHHDLQQYVVEGLLGDGVGQVRSDFPAHQNGEQL